MEEGYSIGDIAHLTGIKPHTLRIWEQRYGLPTPRRTGRGQRKYTSEDLKLLLNVTVLQRNGMRISRIAGMSQAEILGSVENIVADPEDPHGLIESLLLSMIELDEGRFERSFASSMLRHGFEDSILKVVFPFMQRIGTLWLTGSVSPAHEHFVTNLVRRKIHVALDGQHASPNPEMPTVLLFLPPTEEHDLSLLFMHYMLRARGVRSYYFGANVPVESLEVITKGMDFDWFYTVMTSSPRKNAVMELIQDLRNRFPQQKVAVSGQKVSRVEVADNAVSILNTHDSLRNFLEMISV